MKARRVLYYTLSSTLPVLSVLYCVLVYQAGHFQDLDIGRQYLLGIPNYYFFYTIILPFVSAGVIYLGSENRYIRFFGGLSDDLAEDKRRKIMKYQKVLPIFCVLFSVLAIVQDAAEKDHPLPPYSFQYANDSQAMVVARHYACAKQWAECDLSGGTNHAGNYQAILNENYVDISTVTGFASFNEWLASSSWIYRFETLLSFLGALVVSFFIAEVFLLLIVKDYTKMATRNLIIWLLVLASLWFPTKIYSAWYHRLGDFSAPEVFILGLLVLAIGVMLIFFIKSSRSELEKYGPLIVGIFSFGLGVVSYLQPELMHEVMQMVGHFSLVYILIFVGIFALALFFVTEYFISSYEDEIQGRI